MKQVIFYLKIAVQWAALFTVFAEVVKLAIEKIEILYPSLTVEPIKSTAEAEKVEKPHFESEEQNG